MNQCSVVLTFVNHYTILIDEYLQFQANVLRFKALTTPPIGQDSISIFLYPMSIHILETIGLPEQLKRLISIEMEFALSKHKQLCCGTSLMEAQLEMVMDGTILPAWLQQLDSGRAETISVYQVIKLTIIKKFDLKLNFTIVYLFSLLLVYFVDDSCPWSTPTSFDDELECQDGTRCNGVTMGWSCCKVHGGRSKCPANYPAMCAQPFCAAGGSDYCCLAKAACNHYGGIRPCS